jgi:hypothetical protein
MRSPWAEAFFEVLGFFKFGISFLERLPFFSNVADSHVVLPFNLSGSYSCAASLILDAKLADVLWWRSRGDLGHIIPNWQAGASDSAAR